MKVFKKRLLALMMSIAIVCSLLPTSIFAAPEETVTITTESLEDGVAYRDYTPQTLKATGNVVNWRITEGNLPYNLQLDPRTGVISGFPTETGDYTFTVTAKNQHGQSDSKEFTIRIISASDEVNITTESLEDGVVSKTYSQTLEAESEGTITWDITDGSLPDGLSLDAYTGVISGVPTKAGEYTFTVTVTNEPGDTDSKEFTMNISYAYEIISGYVKDSNGNPIANATVTRLDEDGNILETTQTGEDGKYTFSGQFPYGGYQIKVSCDGYLDSAIDIILHGQDILDANLTLNKMLHITTESLEDGVVLKTYNKTLEAEGDGTITWIVTDGSLPDGLSLDAYTGVISGVPTEVGEYTFTVTANSDLGTGDIASSDSKEFTMNISYAYEIISGYVKDSNGNPIANATVTRLDEDGNILETTQTGEDGKYTFSGQFPYGGYQIKVSCDGYLDSAIDIILHGQDILDANLTLNKMLHITTESLEDGVVLKTYNKTLEAEGDGTITWIVTDGSLPDGLSLDAYTGVISGVPTEVGEYTFTVTANSDLGTGDIASSDSKEFTMNISYAYEIISGYVKDSNGNPIEGATVTFLNRDRTSVETYTDKDGKYIISGNFQYGKHFIKASKENYSETEMEFFVTNSAYQYPDDIILNSILPNTYEITDGADSVWKKGSLEGLKFVCNGEYDKFTGVTIDDQTISPDYYTSEKGSTIITLSASYLESLSLGKHKLTINYQDGVAETTFTIQEASVNPSEPPQNGNDSNSQDSANTQNKTSQNENNSSVQSTDTPLTGDNSFIGFFIGLIGLSTAWIITNKFIRRKHSSK